MINKLSISPIQSPSIARGGFTLVEVMISVAIVTILAGLFINLTKNITQSTLQFNGRLFTQQSLQTVLDMIVPELRTAANSADGAYLLATAGTSTLAFYSDIDGDGHPEKIRYYLAASSLNKGVMKPSGAPLRYVSSTEVVTELVTNMVPGNALFTFYDKNATSSASSAMPQPVDIIGVTTIKVTLSANQGNASLPSVVGVETEATIRNLRYK